MVAAIARDPAPLGGWWSENGIGISLSYERMSFSRRVTSEDHVPGTWANLSGESTVSLSETLKQTAGIWRSGDGLNYRARIREQWP